MDELLANATLHVRRRCLGVALRPYSLWHAHVLEALDNPFGVHRACVPAAMVREIDPVAIYAALRVAVAVCSSGYDPELRCLDSLGSDIVEKIRGRWFARTVALEADVFMAHRAAALSLPEEARQRGAGFREAPTIYSLYADLRQYLGSGKAEAWETPVAEARWALVCAAEGRGLRTGLVGDNMRSLIAEVERREAELNGGRAA